MREPGPGERETLVERQASLERMLSERMPVLADFFQRLGHTDGAMVLVEAPRFVGPLDAFLRQQVITQEDRAWILARVAYFVGEYLVQRHGGIWFVDDDAESRHFLRIVVGRFSDGTNSVARIDPFEVAAALVDHRPPRSLAGTLEGIEAELAAA